ncbi:MAG: four helix bundle protein [Vicinamibacterales bacterium]
MRVWRSSLELVVSVYRLTGRFPRSERFGIVSQPRRASVSVCSNIAEGNCRGSLAAYMNHLGIALGSLGELRSLLDVARALTFLSDDEMSAITPQLDEVGRLLFGLRKALKRHAAQSTPD